MSIRARKKITMNYDSLKKYETCVPAYWMEKLISRDSCESSADNWHQLLTCCLYLFVIVTMIDHDKNDTILKNHVHICRDCWNFYHGSRAIASVTKMIRCFWSPKINLSWRKKNMICERWSDNFFIDSSSMLSKCLTKNNIFLSQELNSSCFFLAEK